MKLDIRLIKRNARHGLKRYYRSSFWVTFVHGLFIGLPLFFIPVIGILGPEGGMEFFILSLLDTIYYLTGQTLILDAIRQYAHPISILLSMMLILGVLSHMFLGYPLTVGKSHFFLESRKQEARFGYILNGFTKGLKSNILTLIGTEIFIDLFPFFGLAPIVFAFTLYAFTGWLIGFLLIFLAIPLPIISICLTYKFKLLPYILAENPNINHNKARAICSEMVKGYKMKLFLLDLSFLPLILLGLLCCFVGVLFVKPYIDATTAEAYCCLKEYSAARKAAMPAAVEEDEEDEEEE